MWLPFSQVKVYADTTQQPNTFSAITSCSVFIVVHMALKNNSKNMLTLFVRSQMAIHFGFKSVI